LRLCQLQLEYLKLDRSLVDTAISSVFARDLICALVSECHRHNISVIAEGVESQELSEAWRELNVTLQQGFLFDRPKSIDRLLG
jgi:EAL domain-containing protein (putative c-di-GMP-specific phosphodiesterase class I)